MNKTYDVILVGCGVAGCFAALHLPDDWNILMITKSDLEESDSFLAQGGICVLKSEDDYDSFFEDTMRAGHYENRKESVDMMIRSSRTVIDELVHYGVCFMQENGEFLYTREAAHSTNRILYQDDITGKEITQKLLAQVVKRKNITLLCHTEMVELLCRDNTCDGILIREENGELTPVFADNILLASGGIGGIYDNSTNFPHLTGDALALALRHNIRLQNINYVQIHPTTLYSTKKERRFLISESVRGEGAVLLDKNGNRFVNELLPRDLLTQEIRKQMQKDHTDFVWLSMQSIKDLDVTKRFPNIYKKCLEEGFDITKDWIPVVPAQHYFMGGIYVDLKSKTSMDHLYASGETCCNGVHGANRLASNSLLESLVFAKNAALDMISSTNDSDRFKKALSFPQDELENYYQIKLSDYTDLDAYHEQNKKSIWQEINRENARKATERNNTKKERNMDHEPDYNQIKRR